MEESLIKVFEEAGLFAVFISLLINVVISIFGVLPSVFITAANVLFFGFTNGLLVSILGEALGAIVSFILYRKWMTKWSNKKILQHHKLLELKRTKGLKAFWLILTFRVMPFVPSGAVTLGSAISKVTLVTFAIASTLGKIPSLIIEASAINGFMYIDSKWKIFILLIILCIVIWKYKIRSKKTIK